MFRNALTLFICASQAFQSMGRMSGLVQSHLTKVQKSTTMSQYADAREGSILAAIDLFGCNSAEVRAVLDAWYAVGVGPEPVYDITVTTFNSTNYDAINSINVNATTWSATSTVLEAGYEITFTTNTDLTEETDAVIIEDCSEVTPLLEEIQLPQFEDERKAIPATRGD